VSRPSEAVNSQMQKYSVAAIAASQGWDVNEKSKVGPLNQAGLGLMNYLNGLEGEDAESGAKLSLWQRATRRYMGTSSNRTTGARSFAMGKLEKLRSDAKKHLTLAKSEALKQKESAVARAPASPKPILEITLPRR
jgi:hypothetical protein